MARSNHNMPIGVLTKTIVRSPIIQTILPVRLRHWNRNDVVLVGDDFIHVKEIGPGGHLHHVATKSDFDARIRAARVFQTTEEHPEDPDFVKTEDIDETCDGKASYPTPPQLLVLTLDSNDLVFIYIRVGPNDAVDFVQRPCPLPTFEHILSQPGQHLAVDHRSRALAVAACDRNLVAYAAKPQGQIQHELQVDDKNWCPVARQRVMRIDGVIAQMEFLYPAQDDIEHVILLLIIVDQRRIKAVRIDWYGMDVLHATVHTAQAIGIEKSVPNLLIPLQHSAAFILANGPELKVYKGLLTGSITAQALDFGETKPVYPGSSEKSPMFANWARPRRGPSHRQQGETLYLAREDGLIYWMFVKAGLFINTSHAADFECHIGSAFACLGDSGYPDILAVPGEMSRGVVSTIGAWPNFGRPSQITRREAMDPKLVEYIPNWASVTDMILSSLPKSLGRSSRGRDGIFVTSGRQPYGAITELRHGFELRTSFYFDVSGMRSAVDMWILPDFEGRILMLLSSPSASRLIRIESDFSTLEEVENGPGDAIHLTSRTLVAATISGRRLVQVTEVSICVTAKLEANFEDTYTRKCAEGERIVAATVLVRENVVISVELVGTESALRLWQCSPQDEAANIASIGERYSLTTDVTCISAGTVLNQTLLAVGIASSEVELFEVHIDGNRNSLMKFTTLELGSVCESMVILVREDGCGRALLLCGLRDGRLCAIEICADQGKMVPSSQRVISFGITALKLTTDPQHPHCAFTTCGMDICRLSWANHGTDGLSIESIWITDKDRPELVQGPIAAVARLPDRDFLSYQDHAESMVAISGDECLIGKFSDLASTVSRDVPLSGTPSRALYSERHRCFVSASLRTGVRSFPAAITHAPAEERRQAWPVIDFTPASGGDWRFSFEMAPGERVYALMEWSYSPSPDKTYSFIVIGGSRMKSDRTQKGKISFIQPSSQDRQITGAREGKTILTDAAVTALAVLNELAFVACVGQYVKVYSFSPDERKWEEICPPFKLASGAAQITVTNRNIHITTLSDSLVTLRLVQDKSGNADRPSPRLKAFSNGPRADLGLSHIVLELAKGAPIAGDAASLMESAPTNPPRTESNIVLMSTKRGQIIGLTSAVPDAEPTHSNSADIVFEATLPRSLTRLRKGSIRPAWKPDLPEGVLANNIVGCASDGTLVGIILINEVMWRRLSWVQRLCERNDKICPGRARYGDQESGDPNRDDMRALPMGLGLESRSYSSPAATNDYMRPRIQPEHMHIDGDIVARMLDRDGAEQLRQIMTDEIQKGDRLGEWLREHLDSELALVDRVVDELRILLDGWI